MVQNKPKIRQQPMKKTLSLYLLFSAASILIGGQLLCAVQSASIWNVGTGKPLSIVFITGGMKASSFGSPITALSVDTLAPVISNIQLNGLTLSSGDFASSTPLIIALLNETESGIATWNISLLDSSNTVLQSQTVSGNSATGSAIVVSWNVTSALANGSYTAKVSARDVAGNVGTLTSAQFTVGSFDLTKVMNSPNPFNPNKNSTFIEYQLSKAARMLIYIYSISGERLWTKIIESGEVGGAVGYNSVEWNGRNDFGEIVANGPYVAYLFAEIEGQKKIGKVKMLVLK